MIPGTCELHHAIQFTMKKERDGKIAFLDVLVERKGSRLSTGVYRKKTHTDRYINFQSHHHPRVKSGVISCLRNRAMRVCDDEHLKREMIHLKKTLRANGYPSSMISRSLHQRTPTPPPLEDTTTQEKPKLLYLPYVKHTSEHIQRVCKQIGVKTVFKSRGTLRESLMKVKNPRNPLLKKGVVYEVPCMDCNSSYIGETGRSLKKRLAEHKSAVKRYDTKNGIAVHAWEHQHRVNWDEASVLVQEPRYWKRRVLEAMEIHKHTENTNLDCGLSLNSIWTPFLSLSSTPPDHPIHISDNIISNSKKKKISIFLSYVISCLSNYPYIL